MMFYALLIVYSILIFAAGFAAGFYCVLHSIDEGEALIKE